MVLIDGLFSFPQWDTDLFVYLNSNFHPWLDPVMQVLSSHYSWIVLFLIVSFFMVRRSMFWGGREIMLVLATVGVNSLLNILAKMIIQRPRPCQNEEIQAAIRVLEDCGTNYSFFSAHSSNAFCLAVCTALFFRNKYYTIAMLVWASAVAYSRIYVGKHYPLDVVCGIMFGVLISFIGDYMLKHLRENQVRSPIV
ncbi:phosphatase PAP2 family protein [Dysgonomonas sp. 216]|uniref:phosphatase PAP2 family protein n=1 Tax=Dysgonomonas sp. 216 TaxID=2302934 RepID=UPI0013D5ED45|nr:phosphatase PAP2 family protein [Dysgonomonas sp. 216]NDW19787.1 phosphatase PAP2 family protein [Dysgonomonas sp. 216]